MTSRLTEVFRWVACFWCVALGLPTLIRAQGLDGTIPVRIWAQAQSGSSTGTYYIPTPVYGYHNYPTYQGQSIYWPYDGGAYIAYYVGQVGGLYQYNYILTWTEQIVAKVSVNASFLPMTVTTTTASPNQAMSLSLGANGVVRLEPGKTYDVAVSGLSLVGPALSVATPPGYRVILNGTERNRCGLVPSMTLTVVRRYDGPSGAAGFASSLAADRIDWRVPLGSLRNGDDAGSLRLVDPGIDANWASLFTPGGLSCASTSDEVYVHYDNGAIRQVIANQVAIDIVVPSNATNLYEIRCYNPQQIQNNTPPCTFTGQPFVTYTVRQSDEAGDPSTALKIIREFRNVTDATSGNFPVVRTESTKITRNGTAWTKADWRSGSAVVQETVSSTSAGVDDDGRALRIENLTLRTPSGPTALNVTRTFRTLGFGEAIVAEAVGSSNPEQATFSYYDDVNQPGSLGYVESVRLAGGGWEAYDYADSTQAMSFQGGKVARRYKPFGAYASSVPSRNVSVGEVTAYEYGPDPFGFNTRPTSIQTTIDGVTTAKTTISYSGTAIVTSTRNDYASSGSSLATITQYYAEDTSDAFFRGKPLYIQKPDGVKTTFAYERGTWDGATFVNGATPVTGSRVTAIKYAPGDSLIPGISTKEITIRDARALVARTESHVWTGSTWQLISWMNFGYNFAGLLQSRDASNGGSYAATWDGPFKVSETDESGAVTTFAPDAAGRVSTATRQAATSGATTIAALTTSLSYDAANHVRQQSVGPAGSELVTLTGYDDAGRLATETPPGLGQTTHAYNPLARTHTVTRPDNTTILETKNIDGSMYSRAGTAIVWEYFSYGFENDGRRWVKKSLATPNSARWSKNWLDWLGRKVASSRPSFSGQPDLQEATVYDTAGRVERSTQTGLASTLMGYNAMSQLIRTGMDVDGNGTLVVASVDRIADMSETAEFFDGAWWLSKTESKYPYTGSSAATAVQYSKTSRRLTGLGGSTPAGTLREETRTWDVFNNETRRVVTVDAATKVTTITTTRMNGAIVALSQEEKLLNGLPISVRSFEGLTRRTGYDALSRPNTSVDPRTGATIITYYSNSSLKREVTDPTNKRLSWTAYDLLGRVITTMDAYNHTTRTAYTPRGEVEQVWGTATYPISYGYNSFGERIVMRTYQDPTDAALTDTTTFPSVGSGNETTWQFDPPSGLLQKKIDAKLKFVEYDYDSAGRLWHRYWARTLPGTSTRVTTTYAYDLATGEQTAISYNDGTPSVSYGFNRLGQNTSVLQNYSDDPLETTLEHCLCGKVSVEYFDASFFGSRNLTHLTNPNGDGFKGRTTGYALTMGSTVEQVTDYSYSQATGRLASISTQANGSSAYSHTFNYAYKADSNMVESLSVDTGHPFTITRDFEPNRDVLKWIETKWGSNPGNVRVRYAYTYDDRRQRDSVEQSGDVFADYGGSGEGLGAIHQKFQYNSRAELRSAPTYLGLLSAGETDSNFMSARKHEFDYDGIGNRRSSNTSGVAGTKDYYAVNELNQMVRRENNTYAAGGTVADDPAIRVVAGVSAPAVAGRHGRHWGDNMLVDNLAGPYLGRVKLFAAKSGAGPGGVDLVRTETRTTFLPPGFQEFSHDADGNVLSDGVWSYTWDAENRLVRVETRPDIIESIGVAEARRLEFKYDYLGRRVEKLVRANWNGIIYETVVLQKRFIYDADNMIAELTVSGINIAINKTFTWGLDVVNTTSKAGGVGALLQLADHSRSEAYFPAYDGNGNVVALLNGAVSGSSAGACGAAYEYSPYGELLRCEGTYADQNPLRFSTKYFDIETGHVCYTRRYYCPRTGRWLSRDPKEEFGGALLYGFVRNNPINAWDINGTVPSGNPVVVLPPFVVNASPIPGPLLTPIGFLPPIDNGDWGYGGDDMDKTDDDRWQEHCFYLNQEIQNRALGISNLVKANGGASFVRYNSETGEYTPNSDYIRSRADREFREQTAGLLSSDAFVSAGFTVENVVMTLVSGYMMKVGKDNMYPWLVATTVHDITNFTASLINNGNGPDAQTGASAGAGLASMLLTAAGNAATKPANARFFGTWGLVLNAGSAGISAYDLGMTVNSVVASWYQINDNYQQKYRIEKEARMRFKSLFDQFDKDCPPDKWHP